MNLLRRSSSILLGSLVTFMLAGCVSSVGLPAPVESRSLDTARGKAPIYDSKNPDLSAGQSRASRAPIASRPDAPVAAAQPPLAGADAQADTASQDQVAEMPDVESVPIQSGRIEATPIAADEGAGNAAVITMSPAPGRQAPIVDAGPPAVAGTSDGADATNADSGLAGSPPAPSMPPVAVNAPNAEYLPPEPVAAPAPVAAAPAGEAASKRPFIWPASGSVTQSFTDPKSMGIAIAGKAGDPVSAAADGRVIFSGLGPRGYGKLLIVEHDDDLLSVYGNNRALLVKEGQAVRQGQRIAELGSTGTDVPRLHFEIRRLGKPVDPISYLPPSAN